MVSPVESVVTLSCDSSMVVSWVGSVLDAVLVAFLVLEADLLLFVALFLLAFPVLEGGLDLDRLDPLVAVPAMISRELFW